MSNRVNWSHQERAAVAEEAKKVVSELKLTAPIDHADIIRVVALAQRTLPAERQREVSNLWRVQADLPFLRKAGVIEGRVGQSTAYRALLRDKVEERAKGRAHKQHRSNWTVNGSGLKIEAGIKVPQPMTVADLVETMKVGDSILFPKEDRGRAEQTFRRKFGPNKYESHAVEGGVRIWRTK